MTAARVGREPSPLMESLRDWARGCYAQEAGVELLMRAFGGRFASAAYPWVVSDEDEPGLFWLDGDQLQSATDYLSGGEQRVLAVVGLLVSGTAVPDLCGLLAGLDRPNLHLVLAAFAHAGGSHEQVDALLKGDQLAWRRHSPLVAWPDPGLAAAPGVAS